MVAGRSMVVVTIELMAVVTVADQVGHQGMLRIKIDGQGIKDWGWG